MFCLLSLDGELKVKNWFPKVRRISAKASRVTKVEKAVLHVYYG